MAEFPDNTPDLIGTRIGEYEIVSRLGLGGMGIVYEGRQPLIGKRVAIKILLPQLSADRELVERFISEARAVNEIGHRGIVDIFSFGVLTTGQHYFVMEYLDGQPFDRLIKQRAPIPPVEALWWIEEVCEALHGAHEAGIIHRDIKPSNLFLVDTGRGRPYVKLLDFGIAKLGAIKGEATPQTRASVVVGTPDYMSPEQARGRAISPQTDVYALGCVLFELLTGKRPFKGDNALQTMFMHVENPPPRLSEVVAGLPHELDDLLLWTMEKDPTARPASTDELRAHLEEIRATLPELPPRSSPSRGSSGSSPGVPASSTPRPNTGPRRTLSGIIPATSPPRPTTGPRRPLSGSMPAMSTPRPIPAAVPVDLAFTGEQKPIPVETETKVVAPVSLQPQPAVPVPVVRDDDDEGEHRSRGRRTLLILGAVVLAGLTTFGVVKYGKSREVVETVKPVEPSPVVETLPVAEVKPEAMEVKSPPVVVRPVRPVVTKPAARGISAETIARRIEKYDVRLADKERAAGSADRETRQMMLQAKALAEQAETDAQRLKAWKYLDQIQHKLDAP